MRQRILKALNQIYTPDIRAFPIAHRADLYGSSHTQIDVIGQGEQLSFVPVITIHDSLPQEFTSKIGMTRNFPTEAIYTLHNATLMGRDGLVITAAGQILAASLHNHLPYQHSVNANRIYRPDSVGALWQQMTHTEHFPRIASTVMMYSGGYFHWMMEQLPRLWLLKQHDSDIPILIRPNPPQWLRDSLHWLGIRNIIEWTSTRASVDELVFPAPIHGTGVPSARYLQAVAVYFKEVLAEQLPSHNIPRIYISRSRDSASRRVLNEAELLPILAHYGFELVHLSSLSLLEQIALFSQAEVIVGPHGAGFVNMMHSTNATILEFFEPNYINICFYRLASAYDFRYGVLMGQSNGRDMLISGDYLRQSLDLFLE